MQPGSTAQPMPSKKTARMGDEGKAVGSVLPTALLFEQAGLAYLTWINVPNGHWLLGL
jgi:hypothetical protein